MWMVLGEVRKIVTSFVNKLVKEANLPIYLHDERLTFKLADNILKNMGLNRRQREDLAYLGKRL